MLWMPAAAALDLNSQSSTARLLLVMILRRGFQLLRFCFLFFFNHIQAELPHNLHTEQIFASGPVSGMCPCSPTPRWMALRRIFRAA